MKPVLPKQTNNVLWLVGLSSVLW